MWHAWIRRIAGVTLACTMVVVGWSHGVLYVEGGSMVPALYPGDLIVYARLGRPPERGDLVVFRHDSSLVVHRLVRVRADGSLTMRGDANETTDMQQLDPDDVRGRVVMVLPAGQLAGRLVSATE